MGCVEAFAQNSNQLPGGCFAGRQPRNNSGVRGTGSHRIYAPLNSQGVYSQRDRTLSTMDAHVIRRLINSSTTFAHLLLVGRLLLPMDCVEMRPR
jgi:hypothetical protein